MMMIILRIFFPDKDPKNIVLAPAIVIPTDTYLNMAQADLSRLEKKEAFLLKDSHCEVIHGKHSDDALEPFLQG